ncbi:glucosaminidase domain-containing protein [Treponema sp. HNW]|uniref:glucosaminidase domain-containing protein n=1 Tax=Treponema sp. HNW TaxID=3116654 RepID=UPI003D0ADA35
MNSNINPKYGFLYALCTLFCFLTFSCASFSALRPGIKNTAGSVSGTQGLSPSCVIAAAGIKSAESLAAFFMHELPSADYVKVKRLARLYVAEGALEGINSDLAFAQMCLETGFLRFGGLVSEDMNNFCGLGAIDALQRGNRFNSEREGVRAHIQHLKAYGTAEELRMPLIDPRYKWVQPKGKAYDVYGLSGTWASDPLYGKKLASLLERMKNF